jgi:hypothetical protein
LVTPLLYHLESILAEPLSRPVHRPCPLSSGFSGLCTQSLVLSSSKSDRIERRSVSRKEPGNAEDLESASSTR